MRRSDTTFGARLRHDNSPGRGSVAKKENQEVNDFRARVVDRLASAHDGERRRGCNYSTTQNYGCRRENGRFFLKISLSLRVISSRRSREATSRR